MSETAKLQLQIECRYQGREKRLLVDDADLVLGRSTKLRFPIDSQSISREHLRVQVINGKIWITDLGTTNGTHLGGRRIQARVSVEFKGEELWLGLKDDGVRLSLKLIQESDAKRIPKLHESALHETVQNKIVGTGQNSRPSDPVQKPGGREFEIAELEAKSMLSELADLEGRRVKMEREVAELRREAQKAQNAVESAKSVEQQVIQYRRQIEEYRALVAALEADHSRLKESLTEGRSALESVQQRREELELLLRADEERVGRQREDLQKEEATQIARMSELRTELENSERETELRLKKLRLEAETQQAEAQLRKTQAEKDIEELRRKHLAVERELESLVVRAEEIHSDLEAQAQEHEELESEGDRLRESLKDLRFAIVNSENRRKQLEAEVQALVQKILDKEDDCRRIVDAARGSADQLMKDAQGESERALAEGQKFVQAMKAEALQEIEELREKTERELAAQERAMLDDLAEDRKESEQEIARYKSSTEEDLEKKRSTVSEEVEQLRREASETIRQQREAWEREYAGQKDAWEKEHAEQREKFLKEKAQEETRWREEMDSTRNSDLEALRAWRVEQDLRVQERLSGDIGALTHAVANATLMKLQGHSQEMISRSELLNALEFQLREALLSEASHHGPFNPNAKNETRDFWRRFARKAGVAAALIATLVISRPIVLRKWEESRKQSADASDAFVKRLKEARAKQLELNLELRGEFQANYTDNILYNEAYLELKQDPQIQKEWAIRLQSFFFEVLQLQDRVMVDFVAAESSLIRGLAEVRRSMNARTFKTNLDQMRALESRKLDQEIQVILGGALGSEAGKKHWSRLRGFEAQFYQEKLSSISASRAQQRALATDYGTSK